MKRTRSIVGRHSLAAVLVGGLLATLWCEPAAADEISTILQQYKSATSSWVGPLQGYATHLFALLFAIQLTWGLGSMALRGVDLAEFLAELVNQIMHFGIFFYLVSNSGAIAEAIIQSFAQASAGAGGTSVPTPTAVLFEGINMAGMLLGQMTFGWNVAAALPPDLVLLLCALIVVLCIAYIAALMVMLNVETYIVVSALTLFTGFGGSRWTKDYALRSLTYAMAAGGKLFMLNLTVGVGGQVIQSLAAQVAAANGTTPSASMYPTLLTLVGSVLVLVAVVKAMPDMIGSLLAGTAIGGNASLMGAARTAVSGGAATMASVAGGMLAGVAGLSLARTQVGAAPSGSGLTDVGRTAVGTFGNLAGAARDDVGRRLSGAPGASQGVMGARMAASMTKARDAMSDPPPASESNRGAKAAGDGVENLIRPG